MRASKFNFAFRSLYRQKLYSILNLGGLALGLAVAIVVAMYLYSEFQYDKYLPDHHRIYRVNSEFVISGEKEQYGGTGMGLLPCLREFYPNLGPGTRLLHLDQNILLKTGNTRLFNDQIAIADSSFFQVLNYPLLKGNAKTALVKPRSIVLTQSLARSFFGTEPALGKVISTSNFEYTITGIIADLPENTHHYFEALISYPKPEKEIQDLKRSLWSVQCFSFVKLEEGENPEAVEAAFPAFYQKYMADMGSTFEGSYSINLQPIANLHFNTASKFDRPGGKLIYLYGFAGIGLLILVLAGINYINMATARSLRRIREAAMRKVLGAEPRDIRLLLLAESMLLALAALFLAFVAVEIITQILPFNRAMGKNLRLSVNEYPFLLWLPLLLALLVGIISGGFPAYTLSRVSPLDAFSNKKGIHLTRSLTRKVLVSFQVAVSVAVVIIAFNMYRQMNFIKNKNLGFDTGNVVLLTAQDTASLHNIQKIEKSIEKSPYVVSVGRGVAPAGSQTLRGVFGFEQGTEFPKQAVDFLIVGEGYTSTMGIDIVEGRGFHKADLADTANHYVLVNQTLVNTLNWGNPVGREIHLDYDEAGKPLKTARVVGVTRDFNAASLYNTIEPLVLLLESELSNVMHIRIKPENFYAAIDDIEHRWTGIAPGAPFQFSFLDRNLNQLYEEEMRQSRLILYLTSLAILISFLGFIGLASFTINLRTREIGIRKVLGANALQTVNLVFKELLVVILLAVLAAIPIALFMSVVWLNNFAYRAPLEPYVIFITGTGTLLIGYGIVAMHSFNISKTKTVESLHQ